MIPDSTRIADTFRDLRTRGSKAYVGYVMPGFPDEAASRKLAEGLLKEGTDLLEIAIPFSDPIADGVTIQRCSEIALANGGGTAMSLRLLKTLRPLTQKPLLLMTYLNPVLAHGAEAFAREAAKAGADGIIIPDLTPEEAPELGKAFKAFGIDIVFLAAPTSTPARLQKIASAASGFIYMVSVAGVTGERSGFDPRLSSAIGALKRACALPVVVGFGVSSPETARLAAAKAEGVVAASTVLKMLLEGRGLAPALAHARSLIHAAHGAR